MDENKKLLFKHWPQLQGSSDDFRKTTIGVPTIQLRYRKNQNVKVFNLYKVPGLPAPVVPAKYLIHMGSAIGVIQKTNLYTRNRMTAFCVDDFFYPICPEEDVPAYYPPGFWARSPTDSNFFTVLVETAFSRLLDSQTFRMRFKENPIRLFFWLMQDPDESLPPRMDLADRLIVIGNPSCLKAFRDKHTQNLTVPYKIFPKKVIRSQTAGINFITQSYEALYISAEENTVTEDNLTPVIRFFEIQYEQASRRLQTKLKNLDENKERTKTSFLEDMKRIDEDRTTTLAALNKILTCMESSSLVSRAKELRQKIQKALATYQEIKEFRMDPDSFTMILDPIVMKPSDETYAKDRIHINELGLKEVFFAQLFPNGEYSEEQATAVETAIHRTERYTFRGKISVPYDTTKCITTRLLDESTLGLWSQDSFHPHVLGSTSQCFGDWDAAITMARADVDIPLLIDLLMLFFKSYNPQDVAGRHGIYYPLVFTKEEEEVIHGTVRE